MHLTVFKRKGLDMEGHGLICLKRHKQNINSREESHYRSGVAQRVPGCLGSLIFMTLST